jgi:pyruvate-ferredoxin/flavodoxin oxidoreductase
LFEDNAEFGLGMLLSYEKNRNRIENIMTHSLESVKEEEKDLFKKWLDNKNDFNNTYDVASKLENMEIPNDLKSLINYIPARSVWCVGGDGWAYDIGFGGIDHVLSSNKNIKILVLDTEVYSNTGGQASKSSRVGQVTQFASAGKETAKKDLFRIAMSYPNCYVANISLGANYIQAIKAFKEADEHEGPAIVIAYAPCIEHGIKGGMVNSINEEKLAVESGYVNLMRYDPTLDKLYLDSREPDYDKYEELLRNEVRYNSLYKKDEELAKKLLKINIEEAKKKYSYYKKLSNKE